MVGDVFDGTHGFVFVSNLWLYPRFLQSLSFPRDAALAKVQRAQGAEILRPIS